jgi:hypothetical protein
MPATVALGTSAPAGTLTTGQLWSDTSTTPATLKAWNGSAWVPVQAAGGGTVNSVDGSGGTTGLTLTGGPITNTGTLTLGGILAVTNGGTGASTLSGLQAAALPSQSGNAGKVLSTDGTNSGWITAGGSGTVTSVDVSGGSTGLTTSGGPVTASGTITLGGTLAIASGGTGATTGASALSGMGMSVDASGGSTGLTFSGGPVTSSGTLTMAGTLAVTNGGTGATTVTGAQANLLPAQAGNLGKFLQTDGAGVLSWATAGGGGGGTVTGVTGTAPIVSSGGTAPAISITAATTGAQGSVQVGTNIDVAAGTISVKNASTADKGVIEIATQAEAIAGTSTDLALTPSTGVPKDAATMTGAALIPGGNDLARPITPATGMIRYNNQSGTPVIMEYYDGVAWSGLVTPSGYVAAFATVNTTPAVPVIREGLNISSVVKNSTGDYTFNFTTALSSADYCITTSGVSFAGPDAGLLGLKFGTTPSTTSARMIVKHSSWVGYQDSLYVYAAFIL